MPYPTIADVKAGYLPVDTELTDGEIQTLVDRAIWEAETCCGQSFIPVTRSMVFDGSGRTLQPIRAPLLVLTGIETLCPDGTWAVATYTDVRISASKKMLSWGNSVSFSQAVLRGSGRYDNLLPSGFSSVSSQCIFPAGFQNVRITGDWGKWLDPPLDINDAIGRLVQYAGSCDDPVGSMNNPFETESVPGGRAYGNRTILSQVKANRMTGFPDVDAVFARYPASFGAVTVL